ncbi:MAG: S-layer homology domain-containing protein [Oscillospiraceae bacterium]|nr:S-layer homology domain-containing protein [Oscillospiraceae bacterium]
MKNRKKIIAVCLLTVFAANLLSGTALAAPMSSQEAAERAVSTYAEALEYGKVGSFAGLCGMSVNSTLMVLGINSEYIVANGSAEWNIYGSMSETSGGYEIRAFSASDYTLREALETIAQSDNMVNLMVCFQRSPTIKGSVYGHVFFIHAIVDGIAYYTESYGTTWEDKDVAEGELLAVTIEEICSHYALYTFEGVVQFVDHTYDDNPILSESYPFTDIYESWQSEAVAFCYENGILSGESAAAFNPEGGVTGAMAAQAIYNLQSIYAAAEERESADGADTDGGAWYARAVRSLRAQGIIDSAEFEPDREITREELISLLFRCCTALGCPKADMASVNLRAYADADSISRGAQEAVAWAVRYGVAAGTDDGLLLPDSGVTRAQCAVILSRCAQLLARYAG